MDAELSNAAAVLADPDNVSYEQARAFRDVLYTRRTELEGKVHAIHDPNESGDDRWNRTLATGTDADAEELKAEHDALKRELDRVAAQYGQFCNLELAARQREAAASIPDRLESLDAAADAVVTARKALAKACGELDAAYRAATESYTNAARGQGDANLQKPRESLVEKVQQTAKAAAFEPTGQLYHQANNRPHLIGEQLRFADPVGLVPRMDAGGGRGVVQPGRSAAGI
ncbi:hypothetical protein [Salinisphaera hydrothermalis]|uniref:hypothetical protein n=1 Tax=Salinisphaera hydrothermalis TaxID=563188 RepID=UPI00333E38E5